MLVTAVAFATREAFAVILMRETLGQLPGQPHSRRRRTGVKVLRLALGVVAVVAMLATIAAATEHDREVLSASRAPGSIPVTNSASASQSGVLRSERVPPIASIHSSS